MNNINSWSSKKSIAIINVGDVKLSDFGCDVLSRFDEGLITYEQGKEEIIEKARANILMEKCNSGEGTN